VVSTVDVPICTGMCERMPVGCERAISGMSVVHRRIRTWRGGGYEYLGLDTLLLAAEQGRYDPTVCPLQPVWGLRLIDPHETASCGRRALHGHDAGAVGSTCGDSQVEDRRTTIP
jgi:hypothetical protein